MWKNKYLDVYYIFVDMNKLYEFRFIIHCKKDNSIDVRFCNKTMRNMKLLILTYLSDHIGVVSIHS